MKVVNLIEDYRKNLEDMAIIVHKDGGLIIFAAHDTIEATGHPEDCLFPDDNYHINTLGHELVGELLYTAIEKVQLMESIEGSKQRTEGENSKTISATTP